MATSVVVVVADISLSLFYETPRLTNHTYYEENGTL